MTLETVHRELFEVLAWIAPDSLHNALERIVSLKENPRPKPGVLVGGGGAAGVENDRFRMCGLLNRWRNQR